MSDSRGPSRPSIDDYVDGRLNPAQRHAFERQLAADQALGGQLQAQQAVDAQLRQIYRPPGAWESHAAAARLLESVNVNGHAGKAASGAGAVAGKFHALATMNLGAKHLLLILTVLAVALAGGWWLWPDRSAEPAQVYGPFGYGKPSARQTPAEFYQEQVAGGFTPSWQCPPDTLARISSQWLGMTVSYTLPDDSGRIEMLGASYAHIITPRTLAMLIRGEGEPVLVLLDRAEHDPGLTLPAGSGLHLHRRQLGPVVIYEISPLTQPAALEMFFLAGEASALPPAAGPACTGMLFHR